MAGDAAVANAAAALLSVETGCIHVEVAHLNFVNGNVFLVVIYKFFKCFSLAKKLGMVDG